MRRLLAFASLVLALALAGPAWAGNLVLEGRVGDRPTQVRVEVADGRLRIEVGLEEPYGPGIGFSAMVAPEGTASADDATWLAFAPQSVRGPRYVARSPRGVGRARLRLEGRWAKATPTSWSATAQIPLADLGIEKDVPLRLAVVVRSRHASITGSFPEGAAFRPPSAWAKLDPPEGGWMLDAAIDFDAAKTEAEDKSDVARLDAWRRYLVASRLRTEEMLDLIDRVDAVRGEGDPGAIREAVKQALLPPLDEIVRLRPDLGIAQVFRAEIFAALGEWDAAREALALANDLLEAQFVRAFRVEAPVLVRGDVGEGSDWPAAYARVAKDRDAVGNPIAKDGLDFAEGLLRLAHGEAVKAKTLLDPLAKRYPFQASVVFAAERATQAVDFEAGERQYRAKEDDLPRLKVETSEGAFEVVLLEDDAPNTVKNIVWLAEHGWYDGRKVTRSVPFLGVQAGGDTGRTNDAGPGYAIPSEPPRGPMKRRRMPLRGALLMLAESPDQEAARLFILTGSHLGLAGRFTVFGRVAEGLDVVDRLREGAEIRRVTVTNKRPGQTYRPETVAGELAPEPKGS